MRFASVAIPALATINSATLQFTVDEDDKTANPASYSIFGELSLNAASYTGASGEISSRPRTVSAVAWPDVPSWTGQIGQTGPDQTSTDIAAVIQEIVNQGGWASGNSLALMLEPTTAGANRTAESYNGVPASAALLSVDFTPIPEPSSVILTALGLMSIALYGWRRR
jgi:hypothetical protein